MEIKKVLVIGSGPIIIGQAAEFDYSGTQACRSLREEGISVVLLNSNPATIMTDAETADSVYIEPISVEVCERIIKKERPDAILPTLGGQTGLNMAMDLVRAGVLEKYGVRLLGADADAIADAEDRERFKKTMDRIGEPVAPGLTVSTIRDATAFAESIGYPVMVRPAFTLGGTGGGIANDRTELEERAFGGLAASPIHQILVEKSLLGWKEIEYEVMRDKNDACIIVCAMENVDPVGIHTGDSIVVAPTQTLTDRQYQELRTASLRIIRSLRIEGGCNVQYALDPRSDDYFVIEVNPRVSRSSALASKATGYPIAKIAAKIAIGKTLDQIKNPITGTSACFEPTLDYCVVKIPRWPFDKFREADDGIGTQMKATGETMAIDRSFERALMKALYSLEIGRKAVELREERIQERLKKPNADRLFYIQWALDKGYGQEYIRRLTGIDAWFLSKMDKVSKAKKQFEGLSEIRLAAEGKCCEERTKEIADLIAEAKAFGLSDADIGLEAKCSWKTVRSFRKARGIVPKYRMVDTCAGEFASATPYYYSSYGTEDEVVESKRPPVLILGSGPIRIGQGVEFDYCCVRAAYALKRLGFSPVILNNNPETVSTDFDTADALFFEPLSLESVLDVCDRVKPIGVIAQLGGQTALNLVKGLKEAGVPLLGTSPDNLDAAEDREKFDALLNELGIPKPEGVTAINADEAREMVKGIGYPALIRPSYVIGGQSMIIVKNDSDLDKYIDRAVIVSDDNPILIDRYVQGGEAEIDGICDGKELCIVGIMEHAERAGVHSGDSIAFYPSVSLRDSQKAKIIEYSRIITSALHVVGLVNIQYIVKGEDIYVIEVNPRASRTIPILSKATGIDMIEEAVKCMLKGFSGLDPDTSRQFDAEPSPYVKFGRVVKHPPYFIVKAPVFSERKLLGADVTLGPQMKSTGEVMGMDRNGRLALAKAFEASGRMIKSKGRIFLALNDKAETELVLGALSGLGYDWAATPGTAECFAGVSDVKVYEKDASSLAAIRDDIMSGEISLVVNTAKDGKDPTSFGFRLREMAKLYGVTCLTCADTAVALGAAIRERKSSGEGDCLSLQEYRSMA